jgi:hypothetical protein
MQPTRWILNDTDRLVFPLLLAISTEMEFWGSERLVDILWIIFNEPEIFFFPLHMFFLLAGLMQILLGILQEHVFLQCLQRDNCYVTSMLLTLKASSKLVILMIWLKHSFLLQNNKILHWP